MVTRMTACSAAVRADHLLTDAAWFGVSLMGAVSLNPAAQEGDTGRERLPAGLLDRASNRPGR